MNLFKLYQDLKLKINSYFVKKLLIKFSNQKIINGHKVYEKMSNQQYSQCGSEHFCLVLVGPIPYDLYRTWIHKFNTQEFNICENKKSYFFWRVKPTLDINDGLYRIRGRFSYETPEILADRLSGYKDWRYNL